tara:strand:+ start:537 stop:1253 length:717 start_codon:yes stop_codon:yes gene_type:complete
LQLTSSTFGQGFYDIDEDFKLINSGKKKVTVFKDSSLESFKMIDSVNRTITNNTLTYSANLANKSAPRYNDHLSISYIRKSIYNLDGTIKSTLLIKYTSPLSTLNGKSIPASIDSTLILYRRTTLSKRILTRNFYSIDTGVKVLYRSDYYGYDNNDRLIILIEDDGHSQYTFEYSDDGNISAYYIHKAKVKFEYDELGRKLKDVYVTSTSTYKYNNDSLLTTKITIGKGKAIYNYKYE